MRLVGPFLRSWMMKFGLHGMIFTDDRLDVSTLQDGISHRTAIELCCERIVIVESLISGPPSAQSTFFPHPPLNTLSFPYLALYSDSLTRLPFNPFILISSTSKMKFTFNLSVLASAALLAVPALAFPTIGAMMAKGPNGEASLFEKRLLAANPLQINNLFDTVKGKVTDLNSNANYTNAGDLVNVKMTDMTPDHIYNAFNIQRDGGLLPPAEDADHPWQPPPPGAKRGPCPGLNTLANHGYIPRSGLVNPIELIVGTFVGLNLSPDLSAILAVISFVTMGDLLQMTLSIGDRYGFGAGLNMHGILEGDASVTRNDHYFGNSWDAQPELVCKFIQETNEFGNGNVDVWSLAHSRYRAWDNSRHENPQFNFNPWRMLVAYAESGFVHEVLRGSSVKFTTCMIKSWFVHERFPKGWSKRLVPMTTPELLAWAGVIELLKPTVPGVSVGKGLFIPVPVADDSYKELQSLINPASTGATLGNLMCNAGHSVLGTVPTLISSMLGGFTLNGVDDSFKCNN